MRSLISDLRYAMRSVGRQPLYAAVAVLSLAVAIGANGLVFGLVDNLVLNPFRFPEPDRLVSIGSAFPRLNIDEGFVEQHSPLEIDDMRRASSLMHVAAFDLGNRAVSNGTDAQRVFTALLLDDPLPAMGQPPVLGRGFSAEEFTPGGQMVAIISHQLWTSFFAADPDIIGRQIQVNSQARTVVGVTADGASLIGTDLWIPLPVASTEFPRNRRQFTVMARIAPGVSLDRANAELTTIAQRTRAEHGAEFPEYDGWHLRAVPWTAAITGDMRGVAGILLLAGLLVLLIAGANLTSLMLARLNSRRREIAVRYALGAGGWQVTRLLLMESVAVAGVATVLGLALASALIGPVVSLLPLQLANFGAPAIDLRVIAYSAAGALMAAVVTTLVPAWQARRSSPQPALRDGVTVAGRQRLRSVLVVAELTLAVVLLVGASLLLSSYARIQQVDPGFRTDRLLTTRLTLAWERYNQPGAVQAFFRDYVERLRGLPEVEHAAAASQFPPTLSFTTPFRVEGIDAPGTTLPTAFVTTITPGYFEVLDVPLRAGRYLDDGDRAGQPTVVVVNEAFANRFLDGRSTGRIRVGDISADVVGVVANTRNDTLLRPAQPEFFVTIDQGPGNNQLFLLVRTTIEPELAIPSVRRALAELDPDQPLYLTQTMEQAISGSVSPQRIGLVLVGAFAVAALLIACVGVYGVVSYWVTTRTREIGIRVALGASASQVSRMVARQTSRLIIAGAVLGLIGGVVAGGAADALLYQTASTDPLALTGAVAVLAFVGLVAGYLPARRALRVDPVETLREG